MEDIHKRKKEKNKNRIAHGKMTEGCVVRSTAGRDQGNLFLVMSVEDEYALISDGKLHMVENPKKKKFRHLEYCGQNPNQKLHAKIVCGMIPENAEIRKALNNFNFEEVVG